MLNIDQITDKATYDLVRARENVVFLLGVTAGLLIALIFAAIALAIVPN